MGKCHFTNLKFFEQLGVPELQLPISWAPFVGGRSSVKHLVIDNDPHPDSYLQVQVFNATDYSYRLRINSETFPSFALPAGPGNTWVTWLNVFSDSVLIKGNNRIQFELSGVPASNIVLGYAVVGWQVGDPAK